MDRKILEVKLPGEVAIRAYLLNGDAYHVEIKQGDSSFQPIDWHGGTWATIAEDDNGAFGQLWNRLKAAGFGGEVVA